MKERPIIFSSEMVRAILEGRKTQTRRVIKPQPKVCPVETRPTVSPNSSLWRVNKFDGIIGGLLTTDEFAKYCPYGVVGDRLWVRETWLAYRFWLEITRVRVERVQDISGQDCKAEGVGYKLNDIGWRYAFGALWNKLNAKRGYSWESNPWVWVIEFKRRPK